MEKMTKDEMIQFLKGMRKQKEYLETEKDRLKGSVETLEEAIQRNSFSRKADDSGVISGSFSADKVLHVLLNSQRDIEEETRSMVKRMQEIYMVEDRMDLVNSCLLQIPVREQSLITEFYINDVVIETLSKKTNLSPSYFYRILRSGMRKLLDLYNRRCETAKYVKAERLIREVKPFMPEGSMA